MSEELQAPEEAGETKPAPPPHFLRDERVKVCGKWQKKGYKPSKAEQDAWNAKCKTAGLDPKTGLKAKAKK